MTLAPPMTAEPDPGIELVGQALLRTYMPQPSSPPIAPPSVEVVEPVEVVDPVGPVGPEVEVGGEAEPPPAEVRKARRRRVLLEWLLVLGGAVIVALLVKTFVFQAFVIPSESMDPTLKVGDRVLVNKLAYDAHDLHRGDVVVFERPPELPPPSPGDPEDFIKRVIGLPGDTVVARDGVVFVNDRRLEEPYLEPGVATFDLDQPVTVPPGHIFVMGDNRTHSRDSRQYFGPVSADLVVGRAFVRIWPLDRVGFL